MSVAIRGTGLLKDKSYLQGDSPDALGNFHISVLPHSLPACAHVYSECSLFCQDQSPGSQKLCGFNPHLEETLRPAAVLRIQFLQNATEQPSPQCRERKLHYSLRVSVWTHILY